MPKSTVYAGTFSHYYTNSEYCIIEFQIKILVEIIHHLGELDFNFSFLFPYRSSSVSTYLYFITFPIAIN